jgi:hypothetical protein
MPTLRQYFALCAVAVATACSDAPPSAPRLAPSDAPSIRSLRTPDRYVALGTSISMGWASNGVYYGSQLTSWPALLAFGTVTPMTLPLIQSPGCISPLISPLGAGKRLSGESAAGSTTCANNVFGVSLPTRNLGLASAIAIDVLQSTPEAVASSYPWFRRVLPPNTTAIAAAVAQQPTFVSVELGGNEVLKATSGLFALGVTVVPFPFFAGPYSAILDAVGTTHAKAVLVGLIEDARHIPALRRGDEIWSNRGEFAALHVTVSNDCDGSPNYINVSIKSLNLAFAGAAAAAQNQPNPVFSCADIPGTPDLVMTPADIDASNALMGQMSAFVQQQATARGYAYFPLGALFDRPDIKGSAPYSVVMQLTSSSPYGPYTSLDGVHPNAVGQAVLAFAAAKAINAKYGDLELHARAPSLADQMTITLAPSAAMEMAKRVARERAGEQLSACSMPGGCFLSGDRKMR